MQIEKCTQSQKEKKYKNGSFCLILGVLINLVLNLGVLIFAIIEKYIGFNGFNSPSSTLCSLYINQKWTNFYQQIVSLCFIAISLSFVLSVLAFIIIICWYIKGKNNEKATNLNQVSQSYQIFHQKKVWLVFIINSVQLLCKILFLNYFNFFLQQKNCKGSLNITMIVFDSINGLSILFGISIMFLIIWLRNLVLKQLPNIQALYETFNISNQLKLDNYNQLKNDSNLRNIQNKIFQTDHSQKKEKLLKEDNYYSILVKQQKKKQKKKLKKKKRKNKEIKKQQNQTNVFENIKAFLINSLQTLGTLTIQDKFQIQNQTEKEQITNQTEKEQITNYSAKQHIINQTGGDSINNNRQQRIINKKEKTTLSPNKIQKITKFDQIKQVKRKRVIGKLKDIQKQKKMCHQLYQESIKSQNSDQFGSEGQKITKYINPQKNILFQETEKVYTHPCQYLNELQQTQCGSNCYSNWKMYKQQIIKQKLNVIQVQQKSYYKSKQYVDFQNQKNQELNKFFPISEQIKILQQQRNLNKLKNSYVFDNAQHKSIKQLKESNFEQNIKVNNHDQNEIIKKHDLNTQKGQTQQNLIKKKTVQNANNLQYLNLQDMFNEDKIKKIISQQQNIKIHPQNIVESHQMYLTKQILNFHLIQKEYLQKKNIESQYSQINKYQYPIKRNYKKPIRTQQTLYNSCFCLKKKQLNSNDI